MESLIEHRHVGNLRHVVVQLHSTRALLQAPNALLVWALKQMRG